MTKNNRPYFYFPSELILVDDNLPFLENLSFELSHDFKPYIYSNPIEALDKIKNSRSLYDASQPFLKVINNSESDEDGESYLMDYNKIIDFALKYKNKNEISTLIVDYSMPEINGIEFFKQLKGKKVKKIMLTGEAGYSIAIDAFNDGIIDKFIIKDTDTYLGELFNAIRSFGNQYFYSLSKNLYIDKHEFIDCNEYMETFDKWSNTYNIVEYYTISKKGCVLGLDENNMPNWLLINTNEENEMYLSIAKENHNDKAIKQLNNHENQLYLLTSENKMNGVDNWHNFIFPVSKRFNLNNKEYCVSFIVGDPFNS